MQSFGVLKRVVHIVTTGLYRVNKGKQKNLGLSSSQPLRDPQAAGSNVAIGVAVCTALRDAVRLLWAKDKRHLVPLM
jgi:hypothetical protein